MVVEVVSYVLTAGSAVVEVVLELDVHELAVEIAVAEVVIVVPGLIVVVVEPEVVVEIVLNELVVDAVSAVGTVLVSAVASGVVPVQMGNAPVVILVIVDSFG